MGSKQKRLNKLTAENAELKKKLSSARRDAQGNARKLAKSSQRADRWKQEAATHRTAASRSDARVAKLQKKLDRATAAPAPDHPAPDQLSPDQSSPDQGSRPDASWTVVQLRAEAKARGLSGLSNKPKAELLAALAPARR